MASDFEFEQLLDEAVLVGHHKSKKEAMNSALKEYVMRHKQLNLVKLFGKINYAKDYDYKSGRKNRCMY